MSDEKPKRPPPTAWKPGQSGNPRGRPRRGNALAEVVRSRIPPEAIVGVVAKLLASDDEKVRIAAATWLRDTAYPKPETRVELDVVDARQLDASRVLAELSTDALRELLDIAQQHDDEATRALTEGDLEDVERK